MATRFPVGHDLPEAEQPAKIEQKLPEKQFNKLKNESGQSKKSQIIHVVEGDKLTRKVTFSSPPVCPILS